MAGDVKAMTQVASPPVPAAAKEISRDVARKVRPDQPKRLVNVIKCTNPRCITSLETGCDHIFALTPSGRYRCVYCEQEFKVRP